MPQRLTHGSDVSTSSKQPGQAMASTMAAVAVQDLDSAPPCKALRTDRCEHSLLPLHHLQEARVELECLQLAGTAARAPHSQAQTVAARATAAGTLRAPTQLSITDDAAHHRSRSAERGLVQAAEPPDLEPFR